MSISKPRTPREKELATLPVFYKRYRDARARYGPNIVAIESAPRELWISAEFLEALPAPLLHYAHGGRSVCVHRIRALHAQENYRDTIYWIGRVDDGVRVDWIELGHENGAESWFVLKSLRLHNAKRP